MKEIKLKIDKVKLTFPFGLGFIGECVENLDLSVQEIGAKLDRNTFKWIPVLMYESHKYQCYLDGVEPKFTKLELDKLLYKKSTEDAEQLMASFLRAFLDSLNKNVPKQEGTPEKQSTPKKK
jgi:hypothetical protein